MFFTAPSPGTVALFLENLFYPDDQVYLQRLGGILQMEYEIIDSYGIHLQVDCPDLAMGQIPPTSIWMMTSFWRGSRPTSKFSTRLWSMSIKTDAGFISVGAIIREPITVMSS